jgi:hypothetical protein
LKSLSWISVRRDRTTGDHHWRHPLATNEVSATTYGDDGHTAVWSETVAAATGVPLRKPLDPFGLFTWLYHHGDFSASHADLVERGYRDLGEDPKMRPPRLPHIHMVPATAGLKPLIRKGSTVTPVVPEWHWPGWLPRGKLVVLEGDPGSGKSTVALDLAARLTGGTSLPDGTPYPLPTDVILLSAEDDVDDTTTWRLQAAGANLERIHHFEAITDDKGELTPVVLPLNVQVLWGAIRDIKASLVIIDVLSAYLGGEVDAHKDADVRRALQPIVDMARATKTTVLLLRHLRKENSGKAIYQGNGSIGIAGVARAVHHIGYDPNDPSVRVLAPVKVNTAARPPALTFRLLAHQQHPCAYVDWGAAVELTADELLNPPDPRQGAKLLFCREAIRELLPYPSDSAFVSIEMRSNEFNDKLKELGCTKAIIDDARREENVKVRQQRRPDSEGWMGWWVRRERMPLPLLNGS